MFSSYLSEVASERVNGMLVGFDAGEYLNHLVTTPASLANFERGQSFFRFAQQTSINAYNDGRLADAALAQEINESWFHSLLPERDESGRWIDLASRNDMARALAEAPDVVFSNCPTIRVESELGDLRAQVGSRIPRTQDSFDLMHSIPALAYCSAFISNDRPLRLQAKKVNATMRRGMIIESLLSQALSHL